MITHYTLKDPSRLPKSSRVRDPYDGHEFTLFTSLPALSSEITDYRKTKNYPALNEEELEAFVNISLYESASEKDKKDFFKETTIQPTFQQSLSFIKTVAKELTHTNYVTTSQRQARIKACSKCIFHNTSTQHKDLLKRFINSITNLATFKSFSELEAERTLGTCGMCGCGLRSKIKFETLSVLAGILPDEIGKYLKVYGTTSFKRCWILTESLKSPKLLELLKAKLNNISGNLGNEMLKRYQQSDVTRS